LGSIEAKETLWTDYEDVAVGGLREPGLGLEAVLCPPSRMAVLGYPSIRVERMSVSLPVRKNEADQAKEKAPPSFALDSDSLRPCFCTLVE